MVIFHSYVSLPSLPEGIKPMAWGFVSHHSEQVFVGDYIILYPQYLSDVKKCRTFTNP